jgi:hypothetical protein
MDDLLMLHSLTFDGIIENTSGKHDEFVRVAMVIRLLRTECDFYVDTSTMRLTGRTHKQTQSLEMNGLVDNSASDVARGIYT